MADALYASPSLDPFTTKSQKCCKAACHPNPDQKDNQPPSTPATAPSRGLPALRVLHHILSACGAAQGGKAYPHKPPKAG